METANNGTNSNGKAFAGFGAATNEAASDTVHVSRMSDAAAQPSDSGITRHDRRAADETGDALVNHLNAGPRTPNKQRIPEPRELRERLAVHICPFCGHGNEDGRGPCESCGLEDTDATRSATSRRVGPWFLRRESHPHAAGMKFSVLRELTKQGGIQPDSIVRGPSTQHMWTFAARCRGLAHLFGLCWTCNRRLPQVREGEKPDDFCLYCGALIEPPSNPDQQLEVAETGESIGISGTSRSSQTTAGKGTPSNNLPARLPARRPVKVSGSVGRAAAYPGSSKRVKATLVDPDGTDDALLTTSDLAAAFSLDERPGPWGLVKRLPWKAAALIVGTLLALAGATMLALAALAPERLPM
jgi:hypothetical protein